MMSVGRHGHGSGAAADPTTEQIRAQLERILASSVFGRSARRRQLLRFLVDRYLAGEGAGPSAFEIATKALGRDGKFDPATDPIVRVEIGRLRRTLLPGESRRAERAPGILLRWELPGSTLAGPFHRYQWEWPA